ncbi:MAG: Bcr/CflA family drug resistance efflux transporter [Rhizobiales bacterium 35-68-8]|nr:MAG: Bcr/CflA family drug resistance efflux transporter [Rhizobiales bacterium 35-68-8]
MSEGRTAAAGAAIIVLGPMSMSLYTPAMPLLVQAFGTTPSVMKLTLSVYFAGFAISQLICGPLSDAFGRRPAAVGFFALYVVGSIVAAMAGTIDWLIFGRALQGIGVAAGPAIARAIVRDQFTGQTSSRILGLIGSMQAVGPALAPSVGAVILGIAGWQPIFYVMVLWGFMVLALLIFGIPETNPNANPAQARPLQILKNYATLLRDPGFMRVSLLIGFGVGAIYTLASILPFVMIERVKLTPTEFGLGMVCQTGSFIVGSLVSAKLMRYMDADRLIPFGTAIGVSGTLLLAVLTLFHDVTFLTVMGPTAVLAFGMALVVPGCTTSALSGFPAMAGSAAALMGCLQIGGGFVGSAVASLFVDPALALGTVIPAMGVIAALSYALLRPRARTGPKAAIDPADLEIAADPAGLVGGPGEEFESYRRPPA